MFFSPLEQFTIIKLIPMTISGGLDFSFTNSSLLAALSTLLAFVLYNFACSNAKLVPSAWQNIVESLFEFIYYNVLTENVKKNGGLYFPVIFSVFSFILFCNLLGMIPYSFTVTSHIVITLGLATVTFFGINVIGIQTHTVSTFYRYFYHQELQLH